MSTVTKLDNDVIAQLYQQLEGQIGSQQVKMWFYKAVMTLKDDVLNIAVVNSFTANWIKSHYLNIVKSLMLELVAMPVRISISIDSKLQSAQKAATTDSPKQQAKPRPAPAAIRSKSRLRYSLDDYFVGPCNELAYSAACQMIDDNNAPIHNLFVHGKSGVGKTHLLQGLCSRFIENNPRGKWEYYTAEQFTNEYISAIQNNKLQQFRNKMRKLDWLVIDDVHFFAGKKSTQQEFLHTFDAIDLTGSRVILASDRHPKEIRDFSQALVSRFVGGMVVEIEQPDPATRRRIISNLAHRRGLHIKPDAFELLCESAQGSVRDTEGMLTRLTALTHLHQHSNNVIDAAVVRQLNHSGLATPSRPVRMEEICEVVCESLFVEKKQVIGSSRNKTVVLARSLMIHLAREMTTQSYPELARFFGRKNHSTIVTADQRIKTRMAEDQVVQLPNQIEPIAIALLAERLKSRTINLQKKR